MTFSDSGEASAKRKRKSKSKRKRPVDYPCVRRFRHRRLIGYLHAQRFSAALTGLTHEMNEFMNVNELHNLALTGQWDAARRYFRRLVPSPYEQLSLEGRVLARFLDLHGLFNEIMCGRNPGTSVFSQDAVAALITKLRSSYTPIQLRRSFFLPRVWYKAAEIVRDLVYSDPQLQQLILTPVCVNPSDVLPIGFGFGPRRPIKKQGQVPASVVARSFRFHLDKLDNKNRLPRTIPAPKLPRPGPSVTEMEWFWHIAEVSFQAGYPLELFCAPQSVCQQAIQAWNAALGGCPVTSGADFSDPHNLSIFESILLATSAAAYPVPHSVFRIFKSSLSSTNTDAPVSPTVELTGCAENAAISSIMNAGTKQESVRRPITRSFSKMENIVPSQKGS